MMQGRLPEGHIHDWDESDVYNWLKTLGFRVEESQIRGAPLSCRFYPANCVLRTEHRIRGDSLCSLGSEHLKALGVASVGHRLSILKSIYLVKIAHNVSIEEDDYIPPCLFLFSLE